MYLSEQAETLIKEDFLNDGRSNGAHTEQSQETGVVSVLQATIDTLQGQLQVKDTQLGEKDRQIAELNARMAELSSALVAAQQTAQAAQALHAGTIQQQLTSGETGTKQQHKKSSKKVWWFQKLIGR